MNIYIEKKKKKLAKKRSKLEKLRSAAVPTMNNRINKTEINGYENSIRSAKFPTNCYKQYVHELIIETARMQLKKKAHKQYNKLEKDQVDCKK